MISEQRVLLDTDVLSFLMKGVTLAERYIRHVEGRLVSISFITVGELYFGAEYNNWGENRRRVLESWLHSFVVIPYDREIAVIYGKLMAESRRKGRPVAPNDAWIAACAMRHEIPLITHNAKHFRHIDALSLITEAP